MHKYAIAAVYGCRLFPVRAEIDRKGHFHGYYRSTDYRGWFRVVKFAHKETAERKIADIQAHVAKGHNKSLKGLDLKAVELSGKNLEEAIKNLFGDSN